MVLDQTLLKLVLSKAAQDCQQNDRENVSVILNERKISFMVHLNCKKLYR